jgi:predicted transcriptional regulator
MGLYNFQPRFAPFILAGEKKHTIRALRANPDKPGNTLHLYVGLRHKNPRLLGRFECTRVESITISVSQRPFDPDSHRGAEWHVFVEGVELSESECEALAVRDGFKDFAEMKEFWADRLPFNGQIIHWK